MDAYFEAISPALLLFHCLVGKFSPDPGGNGRLRQPEAGKIKEAFLREHQGLQCREKRGS